MSRQQILDAFRSLAKSQGFYGRLLEYIDSMDEGERDTYLLDLERQNFKDAADLVLYLED